jgi:hypothetical protein
MLSYFGSEFLVSVFYTIVVSYCSSFTSSTDYLGSYFISGSSAASGTSA